jgi:hypothetical protein
MGRRGGGKEKGTLGGKYAWIVKKDVENQNSPSSKKKRTLSPLSRK